MKTTQEIANRLVELCRIGDYNTAYDELFHPKIVAKEPEGMSGATTTIGIEAIKAKGEEWGKSMEAMHSSYVSDPLVAGNYITLTMGFDATFKGQGRSQMDEVIVYKVDNGKIVSEEYFY